MTELDQLIAEFKITLDKFEAIASRMEARIAKTDPVDPLADLPSFPLLPEGFSRWEYRGTFPYRCTIGYENTHYIEAVKDEQSVPEVAVPFPPVPEGYTRWVYRGKEWTSMDPVKYAYWMYPFKVWVVLNDSIPVGIKGNHYIEAVKDPA